MRRFVRDDIPDDVDHCVHARGATGKRHAVGGVRAGGRTEQIQQHDRGVRGAEVADVDRGRDAERADPQFGNRAADDHVADIGIADRIGVIPTVENLDIRCWIGAGALQVGAQRLIDYGDDAVNQRVLIGWPAAPVPVAHER
ncbi:hypothetical protein E4T66_15455 [Sinimarinibacterium sp. CAU 1509]|nr:hypothetical protein E4T66_15455 [Sinimarinibacterium sp. CAU 1509]